MTQPPECPEESESVALIVAEESSEAVAEEEDSGPECRICFMSEDPETFCLPCSCKSPVHLECLERWCIEKGSPRCEICHTEYKLDNSGQQTINDALDTHAARHRPPPTSALELLISGNPGGNDFSRVLQSLRAAQRGIRLHDQEDEEIIRQVQTRRLLMFALMVVVCIIFFHVVGTLLLSGNSSQHIKHDVSHSSMKFVNSTLTNSTGTTRHLSRHDANNSVMGRFFRILLCFYIVRMLFSRPPPDRRGLYL